MLKLPEDHFQDTLDSIGEYTKNMFEVIAFALVLVGIIGLLIWYSGQTSRAVDTNIQEIEQSIAIERLPQRMR